MSDCEAGPSAKTDKSLQKEFKLWEKKKTDLNVQLNMESFFSLFFNVAATLASLHMNHYQCSSTKKHEQKRPATMW